MLRTRLWMGAILVLLVLGVLVVDQYLAPWYPFLLLTMAGLLLASCLELAQLLGPGRHLPVWFCAAAVLLLLVASWPAFVLAAVWHVASHPWHWVLGVFVAILFATFLVEMMTYRGPGDSVTRVAVTIFIAVYLGLLPCFFVQLRWPPIDKVSEINAAYHGTMALALAVFVPKGGDIGAYMTGRFLGRHKMAPVLSPKKTWEGFFGGLAVALVVAVILYRFDPDLRGTLFAPLGFGVTMWLASVLGDLAESLIKRDCRQKDASRSVPGFGGVLDVIDSVLFAAPIAYCWLRL